MVGLANKNSERGSLKIRMPCGIMMEHTVLLVIVGVLSVNAVQSRSCREAKGGLDSKNETRCEKHPERHFFREISATT